MYTNSIKINQFRAKYSEMKPHSLYLRNISKDFTLNNVKTTQLKDYMYNFSVSYDTINVSDLRYSQVFDEKNNIV